MGIDIYALAGIGFVVTEKQVLDYAKKHINEFNEDYAYIDEYIYDVAKLLSTPEVKLADASFGSMYDDTDEVYAFVLKQRSTSANSKRSDGGLALDIPIFSVGTEELAVLVDAMQALGVVEPGDRDGALIKISFLAGLMVS